MFKVENKDTRGVDAIGVVSVSLLLSFNIFNTMF